MSHLLEPFRHGFMLEAFAIAALVGAVCAVLSCFLVLKGWSLMGDAISHAVLPGVVVAYVVGAPLALGAFASGLLCAAGTGWIKSNSRLKEDTVMGIMFTGLFALGLVLFTKVTSDVHLNHILFGSPLGITRADMIQIVVTADVTLAVVLARRRDLLLYCFDPNQARAVGLSTAGLHYLLLALLAATIVASLQAVGIILTLALLAATIVASLQAVGIILTVAMLVTPGCIGYLLTDRFGTMMAIAAASAVFAAVAGTYASFMLDVAPGACIVLVQAGVFACVLAGAPKHGLLASRRRAHKSVA